MEFVAHLKQIGVLTT